MTSDLIVRDGLTDQVIQRIEDMIWSGEISPGSLLPTQKELAINFGVGLSTIREAIKALAHIGMVEVIPGKGTRIFPDVIKVLTAEKGLQSRVSDVNKEEFFEARGVIEKALTAFAATRADEKDIENLKRYLIEMETAQRINDIEGFSRADIQFHLSVAKASKNEILEKMYLLILNIITTMIDNFNRRPYGMASSLALHRQIFDGIISGNTQLTEIASDPKKYLKNLGY